jgi:hypothetical protein
MELILNSNLEEISHNLHKLNQKNGAKKIVDEMLGSL